MGSLKLGELVGVLNLAFGLGLTRTHFLVFLSRLIFLRVFWRTECGLFLLVRTSKAGCFVSIVTSHVAFSLRLLSTYRLYNWRSCLSVDCHHAACWRSRELVERQTVVHYCILNAIFIIPRHHSVCWSLKNFSNFVHYCVVNTIFIIPLTRAFFLIATYNNACMFECMFICMCVCLLFAQLADWLIGQKQKHIWYISFSFWKVHLIVFHRSNPKNLGWNDYHL